MQRVGGPLHRLPKMLERYTRSVTFEDSMKHYKVTALAS